MTHSFFNLMETKIEAVYGKLLGSFGPQHWWPVTKEPDLEPKYHKNIKLDEKQKLEICFSAAKKD